MVNKMILQGKMTKDMKDKLMQMRYNDKDGNKKYLRECLFDQLNFRGSKKEQSTNEQDNFNDGDDGDIPF